MTFLSRTPGHNIARLNSKRFLLNYKSVSSVNVNLRNHLLQSRFLSQEHTTTISSESEADHVSFVGIPVERIRNFSIIAHVDHGKSTLADRLLEYTGAWNPKNYSGRGGPGRTQQILDKLQVEQERGITVKAQTASLHYIHKGTSYLLNLIDTPGHVDFSNEVSRSVSVCQGVILLVDANQGVQAQTVANFYLAFTSDIKIIPVLNKCDVKTADPETVAGQLKKLFDFQPEEMIKISAKTGMGIPAVLEAIVERLPPPDVNRSAKLRALIFDAFYDRYRGPISMLYVVDGSIAIGNQISLTLKDEKVNTGRKKSYEVKHLGFLRPDEEPCKVLMAGQVGYLACGMRTTAEAQLGSTVHLADETIEPLPGFRPTRSMVYAGLFPLDQSQFQKLRDAVDKLRINDHGVSCSLDNSPALGGGFRLGFLGLLHMEVFSQRLEQEFGTETIITAPSVRYKCVIHGANNIKKYGGSEIYISNPSEFPESSIIVQTYEPTVIATIITPATCLGPITKLCHEKRGTEYSSVVTLDSERIMLKYLLPLNEILVDFHDRIKSVSSGYASFDYEEHVDVEAQLSKIDILLNGSLVPEMSIIVHKGKAVTESRKLVDRLCEIIPREQFLISVQAYSNGKILARGNIKPVRKDVAAKLYGGDVTRRMKLLAAQKAGKARLRMVANIGLPRDTYIKLLKR